MKPVNEIFLSIADKDRIRADQELSKGLLSDEMVNALKTDIVNLTNLKNPTSQEEKISAVYINLINMTLDRHYSKLFKTSADDKQEQLSFEFTKEVKNHH